MTGKTTKAKERAGITLCDLVGQTDERGVARELKAVGKKPGEIAALLAVLSNVRSIRPKAHKHPFLIRVRRDKGRRKRFDVDGVGRDGTSYAIEFTPWPKWLASEIHPDTLREMPAERIVAGCLDEMTFCGLTQEKVARQTKELRTIAKSAKEWGENTANGIPDDRFVTLDEVFRSLGIERAARKPADKP